MRTIIGNCAAKHEMRGMMTTTTTTMMLLSFISTVLVATTVTRAVELELGLKVSSSRVQGDLGRIVGGKDSERGEFPHQVSLQWGIPPFIALSHFCGGSIISSEWIVTAGHCIKAIPTFGSVLVKAGKYNIKVNKENGQQESKIRTKIIHEKYEGGVAPYDIGLLKLKKPLKLNENSGVNGIYLPRAGSIPTAGTNSTLSGWGAVSANGKEMPAILQKALLPVLDLKTCNETLEAIVGPSPLHSTNICTGSYSGDQAACSGDSGGPLILNNSTGSAQLIGIVSWGVFPCGSSDAPSVYVGVSHFIDWIQSNIDKY